MAETSNAKIQVSVLTGFLGSGKTTCLNHLLQELASEAVPAVILHRFAYEFELDTIVVHKTRLAFFSEVFDFGTGCLCCSPRGDFTRALWSLIDADESRVSRGEAAVTHLFVETTGLAEPEVFARVFFQDAQIAARFQLQHVLAVVDPEAVLPHLLEEPPPGLSNKAVTQVSLADIFVLNTQNSSESSNLQDNTKVVKGKLLELAPAAIISPAIASTTPVMLMPSVAGVP
ncbi:hypothetical protein CYMTET_27053, partial [Cymbomonas tetramitiformis]